MQTLIERGADHHVLGGVAGQELGARLHHPVGVIATGARRGRLGQGGGIGDRVLGLGRGDIALILHQADHQGGAVLGAFKVAGRGIGRWRLEQTGQHRGLGHVHGIGGFAEVALACGLKPARTGTQIGAVQIDGQDLVLGELDLHRHGKDRLFDLATNRGAAAVGLILGLGLPLGRVVFDTEAQQFRGLLGDG